jgi:hypothetical protein
MRLRWCVIVPLKLSNLFDSSAMSHHNFYFNGMNVLSMQMAIKELQSMGRGCALKWTLASW